MLMNPSRDRISIWRTMTQRPFARRGLSVIRIGYGLVIAITIMANIADWKQLWGRQAYFSHAEMRDAVIQTGAINLYQLSDSDPWVLGLLITTLIVSILFAVGWRTRVMTPVLWVLVWSLFNRNFLLLDGGYNLLQIVLIYLIFADTGAHWSLDSRRRRTRGRHPLRRSPELLRLGNFVHNSAVGLTIIQLCFLYAVAGLSKVQGTLWQNGTAIYYILRSDQYSDWPEFAKFVYSNPIILVPVTYVAVFLQVGFSIFLLNTITRRIALIGVFFMHVGIAFFMGLPLFSGVMLITEAVLIKDSTYLGVYHFVRRKISSATKSDTPLATTAATGGDVGSDSAPTSIPQPVGAGRA